MNSAENDNNALQSIINKPPTINTTEESPREIIRTLSDYSPLGITRNSRSNSSNNNISSLRRRLSVPLRYDAFVQSFTQKDIKGEFLGRESLGESTDLRQYAQICRVARTTLAKGVVEPSVIALNRTKRAAKEFFALAYQLLEETGGTYPLLGLNKCLGMVAIPGKNVVSIAISQDRDQTKDEPLRSQMVIFLDQLNELNERNRKQTNSPRWIFELARVPTQAQYIMPRLIAERVPQPAPESSVAPRTRCVEPSLMASLCKAGRTQRFTTEDTGVLAFGGTMWATPDDQEAIPHFQKEGATRNLDYREKNVPLKVVLSATLVGYIDIWNPCAEHCAIFRKEMLAIGASGGLSSSFFEPRSENRFPLRKGKSDASVASVMNQSATASTEVVTRPRSGTW